MQKYDYNNAPGNRVHIAYTFSPSISVLKGEKKTQTYLPQKAGKTIKKTQNNLPVI